MPDIVCGVFERVRGVHNRPTETRSGGDTGHDGFMGFIDEDDAAQVPAWLKSVPLEDHEAVRRLADTALRDESLVEAARQLATLAHRGQRDKAGHDYIRHPERVARHLTDESQPAEIVAAGWLHDTIEDTWVTAELLHEVGFPEVTVEAVDAVTKRDGESQQDYARRIVEGGGIDVKRADLTDNTDPRRSAELDPATRDRLAAKYEEFRTALDTAELDSIRPAEMPPSTGND